MAAECEWCGCDHSNTDLLVCVGCEHPIAEGVPYVQDHDTKEIYHEDLCAERAGLRRKMGEHGNYFWERTEDDAGS